MIAPLLTLPPRKKFQRESREAVTFFTIGYEQSNPQAFLERLRSHQITLVVDVRQMPLSRKKGFSKNQLRELLAGEGIDYLHLKTLGAPKELRDRLRQNGSWSEYTQGYEKVLATQNHEIKTLINLARESQICLLCFERDPEVCHRSLVAEKMRMQENSHNFKVEHIRY